MKKTLLLVAALAIGGASFAQNKTRGVDIHLGLPFSATALAGTTEGKILSGTGADAALVNASLTKTMDWQDLGAQLKIASYNGLWVNDIIGIYASAGVNFGGVFNPKQSYKLDGNGLPQDFKGLYPDNMLDKGSLLGVSGEFMLGPSVGADLGGVRFQSGLAFHAVVGYAWKTESKDAREHWYTNDVGAEGTVKTKHQLTTASVGLALTPQFRFGASNRLSLVVGADIALDFPVLAKYKATHEFDGTNAGSFDVSDSLKEYVDKDENIKIDLNLRFGFTPYIGLGINF